MDVAPRGTCPPLEVAQGARAPGVDGGALAGAGLCARAQASLASQRPERGGVIVERPSEVGPGRLSGVQRHLLQEVTRQLGLGHEEVSEASWEVVCNASQYGYTMRFERADCTLRRIAAVYIRRHKLILGRILLGDEALVFGARLVVENL